MPSQKSRFAFKKPDGTFEKPLETADFKTAAQELLQILANPPKKVDKNTFHCFGGTRWIINFSSLNGSSDFVGYLFNISLSNSSRREHSYDAKTIKPHRFQLVAKKNPENQLNWIGLIYREETGQEIFIPRPKDMDLEEFAKQTVCLLQAEEGFEVEEGSLHFDLNKINHLSEEIRGRIAASYASYSDRQFALEYMGNPTVIPEPELRTTPHTELLPKFQVPEIRTTTRRRVRDVASENDSFGKQQWRATLEKIFREAFPQGAESIEPIERCVLCFPGAGGKEAEFWKRQGFTNDELVLIEKDPQIAADLKIKYPMATVINHEMGDRSKTRLIDLLRKQMHLMDLLKNPRFSVISLDPEGRLTEDFVADIMDITEHASSPLFFSANFNLKRENHQIVKLYKKITSGSGPYPCHQWRQDIIRALPGHIFFQGKIDDYKWWPGKQWEGNYEGDSDATRMYWVMTKLTRMNGKS
jgi:hypothetical protein